MESRKLVLVNLFSGQQWRNRERIYGHGGRGGGRWLRCRERVTWKVTLPYVKQMASGNLLCDPGNSNRASVTV